MPALGLGRVRKWLYAGRVPTAGKSEILVECHYGAFDFTALRYAYAENAQYNPYDANEAELTRSMVSAMNARDCTSAMKPAPAILEKLRPYQCAHRFGDLFQATPISCRRTDEYPSIEMEVAS